MSFFVAVTGINQENLAQRRLKEKGFEVYFPVGKKTVKHARKQETRIFPVFSRYIFVRSTALWGGMLSAEGVLDVLANNFRPMEVPVWVIEDIKTREAQGKFDIAPEKPKQRKTYKSFEVLKALLNPDAMVQV